MRNILKTLTMVAVVAAVAPACASKGFVRTEVGTVDGRVDSLATTVEETQEMTRRNAGRIGEVDQRAAAAGEAATAAQSSADAAGQAARAVDQRVSQVAEETASIRKLIYEVTINEEAGNFAFGQAELPEPARASLDAMVTELAASPQNVYIEIEGHTDATGPATLNMELGMERAEAVKRYLYETHHVPLHRMNVISYGEDRPVAPNETREGRAQNRRVVVRVLS